MTTQLPEFEQGDGGWKEKSKNLSTGQKVGIAVAALFGLGLFIMALPVLLMLGVFAILCYCTYWAICKIPSKKGRVVAWIGVVLLLAVIGATQKDEKRKASEGGSQADVSTTAGAATRKEAVSTAKGTNAGEGSQTKADLAPAATDPVPLKESPDHHINPPPVEGRLLTSRAVTVRTTDGVLDIGTSITGCIKNLVCYATDESVIITFDINRPRFAPLTSRLLVRLFDSNGQHLHHFVSSEKFTFDTRVADRFQFLQEHGNRLVYAVNKRDLRDTEIIEVGFVEVPAY